MQILHRPIETPVRRAPIALAAALSRYAGGRLDGGEVSRGRSNAHAACGTALPGPADADRDFVSHVCQRTLRNAAPAERRIGRNAAYEIGSASGERLDAVHGNVAARSAGTLTVTGAFALRNDRAARSIERARRDRH